MKGKIRVFCRWRPVSGSEQQAGQREVLRSTDDYTLQYPYRGGKELIFDRVFPATASQEDVFEDTRVVGFVILQPCMSFK